MLIKPNVVYWIIIFFHDSQNWLSKERNTDNTKEF